MEKNDTKLKSGRRNFLIALSLLLLTNILMGLTLMTMSRKTLREQIDQRMLDIANTAAYQLDGDVLKTLRAEDEGTEGYQQALDTLRSFQENIELDYIYGIRAEADGTFTFTIDPTVEDPGEFGSPIKTTDALKAAANGTPSVDKKAYSDAWGKFYSAYSPVFDSDGNVAGIVGVDFNAKWYNGKLSSHGAAAVIIMMVALTLGIVFAFIVMSQNRKRFSAMLRRMAEIDRDAQQLDDILLQNSIKKLDMLPESENSLLKTLAAGEENTLSYADEYDELSGSIDSVYKKLHKYMRYVSSELNVDAATGVGNKVAYKAKTKAIDESIAAGSADFSVAFFDINSSERIYAKHGFEAGEKVLFDCAKLLRGIFGKNNVFHIFSDDFIVICDGRSRFDMEDCFAKFDEEIKKYNNEHDKELKIEVSKGSSTYAKDKYDSYRSVFLDAKAECDKGKTEFYERNTPRK